jgi:DNA-binding MarR family transcriptional regulator
MPQRPVLDHQIMSYLNQGHIYNLTALCCAMRISYHHAWDAVRRLEAAGLVTVKRASGRGRPLIIEILEVL